MLSNSATFINFRRARALFSWIFYSLPDVAITANLAAQVTEKTFEPSKIKLLHNGVKNAKKKFFLGLRYASRYKGSVHLRVYTDVSFATNDDLSSQLGIILLLFDYENNAHIIDYRSYKSRRVVRFIMGGEVSAFMEGFDHEFSITRDLQAMLGRIVPAHMFIDSKQLFDALIKGKQTTERLLIIEIMAARQAYCRFEINAVGLLCGQDSPADGLSKVNDNGALQRLLEKGKDFTKIMQWIERNEVPVQFPSHWKRAGG